MEKNLERDREANLFQATIDRKIRIVIVEPRKKKAIIKILLKY